MRSLLIAVLLIGVLFAAHIVALGKASAERKLIAQGEDMMYVLPSAALKISALEFDGLASDFMFLRSLTFLGSTFERKERPKVKPHEWKWLLASFETTTDLDPYFFDPYYLAQQTLTWDGNLITETNALLVKGMKNREWDWMIPFYIGFNNFYFLHDNGTASEYLMVAARKPDGAPQFFANLASKLAAKSQRTENAIVFLEELLKRTEEEETKKQYKTRLAALKGILSLEQAFKAYEDKYHKKPETIETLVQSGTIRSIPVDPYGGRFFIDSDGTIKTTSNLNPLPGQR